jgi:hypothetical protein
MGQEHRTFRMRGEGKRMEMNLHGTNAPPRRHLLKERLITNSAETRTFGDITAWSKCTTDEAFT